MTDEERVPITVEEECVHEAKHPRCRQRRLPCGEHFLEVSTRAMHVKHSTLGLTAVNNHIADHGWTAQWLLTWAAVCGRYAVEPGQSVEQAVHMIGRLEPSGEPADFSPPWVHMLEMLVKLAMHRDGEAVVDTVAAVLRLPDQDRLSLTSSLLTSTDRMLAGHAEATTRHLFLYHEFGGAILRSPEFSVINDMVEMADAVASTDEDRAAQLVEVIFHRYTEHQQLGAFTLCAQALGRYVNTDDPTPMTLYIADSFGADVVSAGVPDWPDESVDASRPPELMPGVWALRMATAAAHGHTDRMTAWVQHADNPEAVVLGTIYGCLNTIGRRVRGQELATAAARAGTGPPPGHPG